MSVSLGACLPEETLEAILVLLDDGYVSPGCPPAKWGLAACSLVCRHWAKTIRPLLFNNITLRSASDLDQLIAFLGAPALFGQTLSPYIHVLYMNEDCGSPGCISWSHRISLRLLLLLHCPNLHWTFSGRTPGSSDCAPFFRRPRLPRQLPTQTCKLYDVTLSGLQLSSMQGLVDLVRDFPPSMLHFVDVTLGDGSYDLRPLHTSRPLRMAVLRKLCFAQCYKSLSELALWLTLSCLLFAGKDHAPLDDDIQASMAAFFHFSVTLHGRQQSMPDVYVKAHPWYKVLGPARAQGWDYLFDLPETASISIRMEEGIHPYIESVSISCPDFVDAALYPLLDRLPAMLADAARDAHGAPPVFFESQSAAACKALLVVILEERVFTDLSEPALSRVCIRLSWVWSYTVAEILSAPRSVGEGEPCTVLTTAQRMEWVLRGGRNANSELVNKREDYLRELQDAARGAER